MQNKKKEIYCGLSQKYYIGVYTNFPFSQLLRPEMLNFKLWNSLICIYA